MGLLLCFLGALAFGVLGSISKVAEQRHYSASGLVVSMGGLGTLAMLVRTLTLPSGFSVPLKVFPVAVACGVCAAVAYFAFQTSIKMGKVTVGWLIMNLSAGVPAVVSIWAYDEKLTPIKIIALALGVVSVVCVFRGQRIEAQRAGKAHPEKECA